MTLPQRQVIQYLPKKKKERTHVGKALLGQSGNLVTRRTKRVEAKGPYTYRYLCFYTRVQIDVVQMYYVYESRRPSICGRCAPVHGADEQHMVSVVARSIWFSRRTFIHLPIDTVHT